MAIKFKNNASTTLAQDITNVSTSLVVAAGTGVLFPTLAANDYFLITVVDGVGNNEIMKVTAVSADTFTVVRAQENTVARAFTMNSLVELRLTAGAIQEILNVSYATPEEVAAGSVNTKAISPATVGSANVASAVTAGTCTGNAATASDMAAGHVLAGATTADGVLSKIAPAVTTPAKLDNSTKIATTAFVKSAAGNLAGYRQILTSATMTTTDIGGVIFNTNAGTTITLLDPRTIPVGSTVVIVAHGACTLATPAGTLIYSSSKGWVPSIFLRGGTTCVMYAVGEVWHTYSGSPEHTAAGEFANLVAGSGYQKLPNGLILQWVRGTNVDIGQPTVQTLNWPVAFPTGPVMAFASYETTDSNYTCFIHSMDKTTVKWGAREWNGYAFTGTPIVFGIGR